MAERELTGRMVLLIAVSAFGVIIAVNFTMAFLAVGSFPGLEVKNTYVTSQSFDRDRDAQQALGWQVETGYDGETLSLTILDRDGNPAAIGNLNASVGRATHANADVTLDFAQSQSPYSAKMLLDFGKWEMRILATAADGTRFRQRLPIIVKP